MKTETQIALAKLLPEQILVEDKLCLWKPSDETTGSMDDGLCIPILGTEWLDICHYVEKKLDALQQRRYGMLLMTEVGLHQPSPPTQWRDVFTIANATAEQRAEALLKVLK